MAARQPTLCPHSRATAVGRTFYNVFSRATAWPESHQRGGGWCQGRAYGGSWRTCTLRSTPCSAKLRQRVSSVWAVGVGNDAQLWRKSFSPLVDTLLFGHGHHTSYCSGLLGTLPTVSALQSPVRSPCLCSVDRVGQFRGRRDFRWTGRRNAIRAGRPRGRRSRQRSSQHAGRRGGWSAGQRGDWRAGQRIGWRAGWWGGSPRGTAVALQSAECSGWPTLGPRAPRWRPAAVPLLAPSSGRLMARGPGTAWRPTGSEAAAAWASAPELEAKSTCWGHLEEWACRAMRAVRGECCGQSQATVACAREEGPSGIGWGKWAGGQESSKHSGMR